VGLNDTREGQNPTDSDMAKAYDPKAIEADIFAVWQAGGYFCQQPVADTEAAADSDTPAPYVITIPPPNVTGSLHMGHALNNTIQDVLIRKNRMAGRPTRWVVGTDHAGIATQNKVEQKLAKEGLTRFDIGREAFIEKCWEWRDEHGSQIINQLKAMGCSCDYDDEWFTMDESYQRAVRKVFIDWYNDGLIYRGNRIINWCPRCTTALSDIEVEHEDKDGKLYYIRYPLTEAGAVLTQDTTSGAEIPHQVRDGGGETGRYLTIATTRPETMLGDVAVAVSPDDERYRDFVGASVMLPLMDRLIPVIADEYVDPEFGTGALKITPAHDANDYEVGERHGLEQLNIFDKEATVTEAGGVYAGLSREEARERVVADLEAAGLLVKIEEHPHSVGVCYRCATAIEPWLSEQWFVDMKPLAAPAIKVVRDDQVVFHPKRWENVYYHWMENIRDWCISRQLWWGHRIPVYYCGAPDENSDKDNGCSWTAALEEDVSACPECGGAVHQDEDVLDTWFSSQIWPFAVLGWPSAVPVEGSRDLVRHAFNENITCPPQNGEHVRQSAELTFNYPTSALSTAPDILFLWVARMVMSGLYFLDDIPFKDVIIHPTVFNKEGRRMSKSLGTGVDPLDLMEHYGADGMRFGLMLQVTGVQDMKFDEDKLLSSRNFANKIWNAARFVLLNTADYQHDGHTLQFMATSTPVTLTFEPESLHSTKGSASAQQVVLADQWILSRLAHLTERVTKSIDEFAFGEASRDLYGFFWNDFCDWYIELAKGRLAGGAEERQVVQQTLIFVLDNALRLLHPLMPYISEEIWQKLPIHDSTDSNPALIVAAWPDPADFAQLRDHGAERRVELLKVVVSALRSTRARYQISPRTELEASIKVTRESDGTLLQELTPQIAQLANARKLRIDSELTKPSQSAVTVAGGLEIYVHLEGLVDLEAEQARLTKERDKVAKDLARFEKKLSNEGFLAKAVPEIIEKDRAKAANLREVLAKLEAQLD